MGISHIKAAGSDVIWGFALTVAVIAMSGAIIFADAPVYPTFFWSVLAAGLAGITLSAILPEPRDKLRESRTERLTSQPSTSIADPTEHGPLRGALHAGSPILLSEPRAGCADPLHRIDGIDTKLEALLNAQGVFHFDQIAAWGRTQVAWVEDHLEGASGRVTRDRWGAQAKQFKQPRKARKEKPRGS